jgi:hypothetical protein
MLLSLLLELDEASSYKLLLEATCWRHVVLSRPLQLLSDTAVLGCPALCQGQLLSDSCVDGIKLDDGDAKRLLNGHRDVCWAWV